MRKGTGDLKNKTYKKEYLPYKICPVCGLPFNWRKKWQRNWDYITYCSEKCRMNKKQKQ